MRKFLYSILTSLALVVCLAFPTGAFASGGLIGFDNVKPIDGNLTALMGDGGYAIILAGYDIIEPPGQVDGMEMDFAATIPEQWKASEMYSLMNGGAASAFSKAGVSNI